ncbi:hypothetical protein ACRALDRAFT_1071586 [Sodiomyces alcalophilus JCM 7366]|uniref:uncharacterized protein n=1 Tax=Sodiomyces alcalophilus JCM 7366 TaxID=591952 RepID=UPI0039B3C73C
MSGAWAAPALHARDEDVSWWYTRDGRILRWSLFFGVVALFVAYLVIGYHHASRRIRRGLLPLAYHRWMIKRSVLAHIDPRYAPAPRPYAAAYYTATYRPADAYGMGSMPPPPVYDPNAPRPPAYAPPEGGTKVNPAQNYGPSTSWEYAPPPGPPPQPQQRQHEGVTADNAANDNPFRG